ncbi:DNA (cytosine-5)-methyltransferase 1 [Algoriphagus alkaliphilus]|uniref:Cytosine-specific methyltransferase n=1 Tax=Algoriphagus alkaliphilus TaxID=279824 RepID=A0A1G5ZPB9_9BACT|nr:DNA cytosine methyltransferase [Algoriphagus alkaliphilus]MBA4300292.1 modification methylase SinI [Cyclobacterium sp.]SDA96671.1 DNA (cytosine-5)-methyltransferase 1 [Algoriphagus alkaliphilus]
MLSVSEAALKLGLSPQQVRNLCRDGKVKSEKIGSTWILNEKSLDQFIDNSNSGVAEDRAIYGFQNKEFGKPIALSFFSGAMGLDIGLEKAGFQTLLASEIDKACRKTILKNKPNIALVGDISNYSPGQIRFISGLEPKEDIDLVVGGPPCQSFSTAGKRKGFEDSRGNVFLTFIEMIIGLNPRFAVIENVRGLLSAPINHVPHKERDSNNQNLDERNLSGGALKLAIDKLRAAGYSLSFNLYNSANFGTPQKRERVIIICSRDTEKVPYLQPTHSENGEFGLENWNTFRSVVSDLKKNDHEHLNFPEKRLKYYKRLKEGQNWRSLPFELQIEAMGASYYSGGGKTGFLRRIGWDEPSPTLVTHPAMPATDLCHPEENRPLSIQEYKRIQQFPDDWEITGTLLEKYKQIGNAVPVGLGFALGKHLIKIINNEPIINFTNFKYSRYLNTDEISWENEFQSKLEKILLEI